jgi:hypothetical protein
MHLLEADLKQALSKLLTLQSLRSRAHLLGLRAAAAFGGLAADPTNGGRHERRSSTERSCGSEPFYAERGVSCESTNPSKALQYFTQNIDTVGLPLQQ